MRQHRRLRRFLGLAIATAIALPLLLSVTLRPVLAFVPEFWVAQSPPLEAALQQADEQFYNRDYGNAEQSYRELLNQLQQETPNSPAVGTVTYNLARTYLLTEQYSQALPLLQSLDNGTATPNLLSHLALAHYHLGNFTAAEPILSRVLEGWEAIRAGNDLTDLDKVTLFEQQADSYELMQKTLVAQGKPNEALIVAERGKARALVEQLVQAERGDRLPPPLTLPQLQGVA